jgi:hypothetical protein
MAKKQNETLALPAERQDWNAAADEERRAAELLAQSRAQQEDPGVVSPPAEDESLVSVMAQGREHLLQRMREHAAATAAKKDAYVPPPMTDRQRERLAAEQEAGRKARERHEAQATSRPVPKKEKWDGTNTPVMRPGNVVPDPALPAAAFAAGTREYGPDA